MKFLFDHNLSFRLVASLEDVYPGSTHVRDIGLASSTDKVVWEHARQNGFVIVSKDADFHQRSLVLGAPPKVVWIGLGNCSTSDIAALLRRRQRELLLFEQNAEIAFLALA